VSPPARSATGEGVVRAPPSTSPTASAGRRKRGHIWWPVS
jgi:hypothetical protein